MLYEGESVLPIVTCVTEALGKLKALTVQYTINGLCQSQCTSTSRYQAAIQLTGVSRQKPINKLMTGGQGYVCVCEVGPVFSRSTLNKVTEK